MILVFRPPGDAVFLPVPQTLPRHSRERHRRHRRYVHRRCNHRHAECEGIRHHARGCQKVLRAVTGRAPTGPGGSSCALSARTTSCRTGTMLAVPRAGPLFIRAMPARFSAVWCSDPFAVIRRPKPVKLRSFASFRRRTLSAFRQVRLSGPTPKVAPGLGAAAQFPARSQKRRSRSPSCVCDAGKRACVPATGAHHQSTRSESLQVNLASAPASAPAARRDSRAGFLTICRFPRAAQAGRSPGAAAC
ncbi:MAG: hypothetical protein RLZZ413_3 [Pseudomonadota bacterium]